MARHDSERPGRGIANHVPRSRATCGLIRAHSESCVPILRPESEMRSVRATRDRSPAWSCSSRSGSAPGSRDSGAQRHGRRQRLPWAGQVDEVPGCGECPARSQNRMRLLPASGSWMRTCGSGARRSQPAGVAGIRPVSGGAGCSRRGGRGRDRWMMGILSSCQAGFQPPSCFLRSADSSIDASDRSTHFSRCPRGRRASATCTPPSPERTRKTTGWR